MDLVMLGRQIAQHFRDLHHPDKIGLIQENCDYLVLSLDNEYVFKIAKHQKAKEQLEQSREFLLPFQGQLGGVQVPYPKYYFQSEELPYGTIGYRILPGELLDTARLTQRQMERVAVEIADFLVNLHQLEPHKLSLSPQLYPPPLKYIDQIIQDNLGYLHSELDTHQQQTLTNATEQIRNIVMDTRYDPRIIHADFWFGNILVDHDTGQLFGVLDFSSITLGNPMVDIATLTYSGSIFRDEVLLNYLKQLPGLQPADMESFSHAVLFIREVLTLGKQLRLDTHDRDTLDKLRKILDNMSAIHQTD